MATATTLSIFPPPRVPRISIPNPHNRKPSLKTVSSPESAQDSNAIKESVVIALQEVAVPKIPDEYNTAARVRSYIAELPAEIPISASQKSLPPPPLEPPPTHLSSLRSRDTPVKTGSSSNHGSPEPESISSSDTLVHSGHDDDNVVPIRSMFPVYNPSKPLNQQQYYPQRTNLAYSPSPQSADQLRSNARSLLASSVRDSVTSRGNQPSVVDIPLDVLEFKEAIFSSPKDLEQLWDASHATENVASLSSFSLEMGRISEAIFAFGSTPGEPFYTATTYDTSELSITKTCPRKRTVVCDIALSQIEPPARRAPPNDGLVSFIFPKTAAMLAINQSAAMADQYGLDGPDREAIQEDAIRRAAIQEASNLRWNAIAQRYELQHPAISRRNREPDFIMSPLSPQGEHSSVLHINVATSDQSVRDQPVILITYPAPPRCTSPASGAGISSPMSAEATTDVQLASLDFSTNTLHIEANNIIDVMPSCFAIDSVVAALISVAIADPDTNAAMGGMKTYKPKPPKLKNISPMLRHESVGTPRSGAFFATIAEREEAEEEARAAAKTHKKSMKSKSKPARFAELPADQVGAEAGRTWYGKSKAKKQKKKKQIVIGEYDIEKLTHYQSGSRQGQELPAVTRVALTAMVSLLKFIVWILNKIVQFLAWLMVGVTRGVTSEKF